MKIRHPVAIHHPVAAEDSIYSSALSPYLLKSKNKDRDTLKAKIKDILPPKSFILSESLMPTTQREYANTEADNKIKTLKSTINITGNNNKLNSLFIELNSNSHHHSFILKKNGAENRIRTDDLRITNALLYQLSYLGKFEISFQH